MADQFGRSNINRERLIQGVTQDMGQAQQKQASSSQALGIKQAPRSGSRQSFMPKALRVRGKAIGQNELRMAGRAIDKAVDRYAQRSQFTDANEEAKFKIGLRQKLQEAARTVLQTGLQAERAAMDRGINSRKRAALMSMIGGASQSLGGFLGQADFSKTKLTEDDYEPMFQGGAPARSQATQQFNIGIGGQQGRMGIA